MIFVIGYIGTRYRGLQINPTVEATAELKSVEAVVRDALVAGEFLLPSNADELERKANWSRSSRTDRGVHALRLVISARLLVRLEDLNEKGHCPPMVQALNELLPEDVRCFGAVQGVKSFDAKKACSWREYEYLLPSEILRSSAEDTTEHMLERLQRQLRRFEGCHSFHNFARLKQSDLAWKETLAQRERGRGKKRKATANETAPGSPDEPIPSAGEEETTRIQSASVPPDNGKKHIAGSQAASVGDVATAPTPCWVEICARSATSSGWRERPAGVMKHAQGTIFMCTADLVPSTDLVRITLRGQFFLYNQIRIMVGSAVAVCAGFLSDEMMDFALKLPVEMHMPLMPPDGLLLSTAGQQLMNERAGHCAMDEVQAKSVMLPEGGFCLLDEQGAAAVELFTRRVEARIAEKWREGGALTGFREKLQTLRMPSQELLDSLRAKVVEVDQAKAEQAEADLRRQLHGGHLIPRRFSAELTVRFRLVPGWRVGHIQAALDGRLRRWIRDPQDRPAGLSTSPSLSELLDYVAQVGADELAEEGREQSGK